MYTHIYMCVCVCVCVCIQMVTLGKTEGRRRRQQRMKCFDSITDSMDMSLSKLREIMKDREACLTTVHGLAKSWT